MLFKSAFSLLLLASMQLVVLGSPAETDTQNSDSKCPASNLCYRDEVKADCPEGAACISPVRPVIACAWECGNDNLPSTCKSRCKPCKAEVCTAQCECEIECDVRGPCKGGE
ncbi:hypothetical protein COEREDRAFT_79499 [Coemansia reversa NRRL 1564]|uniref:TNFR-Cys domain-containing protein n=1 Tax=Coemansia reversa (strain ATCC 12441 / NRRL 1564) TaxID=763665 RepID=A0A2G5BIY4_COERN|nr:hypothetical protein COEREDRAFT_79499 [Coemansia reversa NRRL 1564]|eukprot:PIA18978.1 hypothetical protein COEREDRAFT_79499 [Coemansia reversa NRRL 1564]